MLTDYACYNFEIHFKQAKPTLSLREELLAFQVGAIHKDYRRYNASLSQSAESVLTLEDLWYFIPVLFACLDNSEVIIVRRSSIL